jgi:hypothetical protein
MGPSLKCLLIVLISLSAVSGCETDEINEFKFTSIKKLTLSDTTQQHLPRMYATVISNSNNSELAFSNYTSPMGIVITDLNGSFVTKLGTEGRGPGEIQSTRYFGFDDENDIVVLDKVSASFLHFDRSIDEISQFPYPINDGVSITSRNLEFCKGYWYLGTHFIGKPTLPEVPTISVFDTIFTLVDSLGGYDPFFSGRSSIMQETEVSIDCDEGVIYTLQSKVPFVQVYSISSQEPIGRTNKISPSFNLSEKFVRFVSNPREWIDFLSEEQSLSLRLAHSEKFIFHVFRNERKVYTQPKNYNDSDYFVAVYDKKTFDYLAEVKMPGAVLGSTKNGELIVLTDEMNYEFEFLRIEPISPTQSENN